MLRSAAVQGQQLGGLAARLRAREDRGVTESFEVSWELDGIRMEATVLRPDGDGPFPAVVFVAGSGPTDRDWCSPALPGENGGGRAFAEAFAAGGVASIRYDKRASGPRVMENLPQLVGRMSMRSHLDELVAAIHALAGQEFVDALRIVGFGNSEGTLHVLHYALRDPALGDRVPGEPPFVGLVLIGGRDAQVDARADGDPLRRAAAGRSNVTFATPEFANHVFKEDRRTPEEAAAAPGVGYNEPGTHLDPESLALILDWLRTVFSADPAAGVGDAEPR